MRSVNLTTLLCTLVCRPLLLVLLSLAVGTYLLQGRQTRLRYSDAEKQGRETATRAQKGKKERKKTIGGWWTETWYDPDTLTELGNVDPQADRPASARKRTTSGRPVPTRAESVKRTTRHDDHTTTTKYIRTLLRTVHCILGGPLPILVTCISVRMGKGVCLRSVCQTPVLFSFTCSFV